MHFSHPLYHSTMSKEARRIRRAIGQRIRQHRDRLRMSLDMLARHTNIPLRYLDHFELGKSDIQLFHIVRIANAFGIRPEELLSGYEEISQVGIS